MIYRLSNRYLNVRRSFSVWECLNSYTLSAFLRCIYNEGRGLQACWLCNVLPINHVLRYCAPTRSSHIWHKMQGYAVQRDIPPIGEEPSRCRSCSGFQMVLDKRDTLGASKSRGDRAVKAIDLWQWRRGIKKSKKAVQLCLHIPTPYAHFLYKWPKPLNLTPSNQSNSQASG